MSKHSKSNNRRDIGIDGTTVNAEGGTTMSAKNKKSEKNRIIPTQLALHDLSEGVRFDDDGESFPYTICIGIKAVSNADGNDPRAYRKTVSFDGEMTKTEYLEAIKPDVFYSAFVEADSLQELLSPTVPTVVPVTEEDKMTRIIFEIEAAASLFLTEELIVRRIVVATYAVKARPDDVNTIFKRSKLRAVRDEVRELVRENIEARL